MLLAIVLSGCGGGGRAAVSRPGPAAACIIGAAAAPPVLTVAVGQAADRTHAPAPHTPAERLIFRQLYETLVRIDCAGTVLPGLAESWSVAEQGRVWQFRLRSDAVFADGAALTTRAVVESWSATPHVSARVGVAFASVTALGERDLRVELRAPSPQPYLFAHPDLAVARRVDDLSWPAGSGPFRSGGAGDTQVLRIVQRSALAGAPAAIEFRTIRGADARAALDAGVDVLVTTDPAAVAYARALPAYSVTALPWNRTYILAARGTRAAADTLVGPPADALLALARAAVPGDARVAAAPFWWDAPQCGSVRPETQTRASARAGARAILYPRGDAIARGIAERVVALAWPVARAPAWLRARLPADYAAAGAPVAAGVEERAVLDSLRTGGGLAVITALPRNAAAPCAAATFGDTTGVLVLLGTGELRITPLLDAHDYLVHRTGFGRVTVESDGTLVFDGGGS